MYIYAFEYFDIYDFIVKFEHVFDWWILGKKNTEILTESTEVYSEHSQTSKMDLFLEIVNS